MYLLDALRTRDFDPYGVKVINPFAAPTPGARRKTHRLTAFWLGSY